MQSWSIQNDLCDFAVRVIVPSHDSRVASTLLCEQSKLFRVFAIDTFANKVPEANNNEHRLISNLAIRRKNTEDAGFLAQVANRFATITVRTY